jgi:methylmalonyl-CoA mutase C-terminal domain/subunit
MSAEERPIRVVIAKPGLDGHDRGAKVIARALRDAGCEVIYTGLHQTPVAIAATAVQEDADVIGISILSGAHLTLFPELLNELAAAGEADIPVLKSAGVAEIFTPGTTTQSVVDWVNEHVSVRR